MQEANRFLRENPGKPFPPGLLDRYENSADALIKRLDIKAGGKSKGNLMARLSLVNYLLRTNRRDVAEARLTELANDYPDSIDVLQMQVLSLVLPRDPKAKELDANGVAAADVLIQKFIREYPRVSQGKAFYASWLMRTNRVEKALEYLKNPENFPGGRGDAINRLLADALMRSGQRAEAQKVLDTLPHSPTVDAQLIMISGDAATADKRLTDAMTRYEEQGRFRLAQARLRLAEGKYEEGIRGLVSAAEFADVGPAAKSLLPLALIAYVDADPAKGREAAVRLSAEMPEELGTYLATALACVFLEEIGTPNDRWEQTKTMYSALNRWEAVAQKQGMKRADTTVTRAMYRVMAGDVDGARQDLAANLSQNPTHVPTMVLLTELALSLPADPVRARELYDMIAKEDPKNPRLMALDAQIKATSGDWLGAAAVYERVIAAEPRNSGAYSARVAALESAKKPDDALQTARDWAARIPDDPRAVVEVVRLLTTSGNKAEAVKTADEYVARRAAEVRKALTEAKPPPAPADIEKTVDQARGFALMAVTSAFFRANAYDEAEARCKEVRKMFPNAEKVILMLGDIATGKQDWDAALALYRELLKQNPRHFIAGNNAAWILAEKKNDPNGALAIVEEVRRSRGDRPIGPERLPPEFLDTIGSVYMKLNRPERFAEMRLIFDAAVKRYPIDPRMYLFLANAQAALGDKPKALENYRLAIHFAGQKNTVSEDQNKAVKEKAEAAVKQLGG
jgi:predicted Zn-dependent protease